MVSVPKINFQNIVAKECINTNDVHTDLVVRNTFIDFKSSSSLTLRRSKSDSQICSTLQNDLSVDCMFVKCLSVEGPPTETTCTPRSQTGSLSPESMLAHGSSWADIVDTDDEAEGEYVPGFSKGSLQHEAGKCSPCRFWIKLGKCDLGEECGFCHAGGHVLTKRLGKRARERARIRDVKGASDNDDSVICGACACEEMHLACTHAACSERTMPNKTKRLGKQARDRARRRAAAEQATAL